MKKLLIAICCIISAVCISLLSACEWLDNDQSDLTNDTENSTNNFSQYFIEECPISFTEKSVILPNNSDLQLIFLNTSDKKIIAYEAIIILYNVYGEELIYGGHISPYNQIAEAPTNFGPGKTDIKYYSISSKVYYAEVYIYYALFDDQTSWGCRKKISTNNILELVTKYKIERA